MSQLERLQNLLQSGQTINRLNAWKRLGIIEAPARISELRAKGFAVKTTIKEVKNRYGEKTRIAEWSMGERK